MADPRTTVLADRWRKRVARNIVREFGAAACRLGMLTFDLKDAHDLRAKMRRDLQRLRAAPLDPDCAFNFFVTAEHMLDWIYPKKAGKADREAAKQSEILLRICSHLANGLKHFEVESKQHDSVSATAKAPGFFNTNYYCTNYWE
jgi:hypothetical protein